MSVARSVARLGLLVVASCLAVSAAYADPPTAPPAATPDVATLLFETPQWTKAPVGATLTYSYDKKTDLAYGAPFDDRIILKLDKGDDAESRAVDVKMFSGQHTRSAGPFMSGRQNPVLLLALEANLEDIAKAWHGNPRYLKDAIRKAWRDDAKVEKAQIEVAGKMVPGTRITVEPFKDDPEKDNMKGLETMVYTVEVADSVPGYIAAVDIHAPATGTPSFSEILRYQSETTP